MVKSYVDYIEEIENEKAEAKRQRAEARKKKKMRNKEEATPSEEIRPGAFYRAGASTARGIYKASAGTVKLTGKAVKTSYNFLGLGGTLGLAGGALLTYGPIGGLVGILVGKNFKPIAKTTVKGIYNLGQVYTNSRSYEELEPTSKYTPRTLEEELETEHQLTPDNIGETMGEKVKLRGDGEEIKGVIKDKTEEGIYTILSEDGQEYQIPKEYLFNRIKIVKPGQKAGVVKRLVNYLGNTIKTCETKVVNAAKYNKLKSMAKEISEKEEKEISPEDVHLMIRKKKAKEELIGQFNELGSKLQTIQWNAYMANGGQLEPEQVGYYNRLAMEHMRIGMNLGINDPSKFYKPYR